MISNMKEITVANNKVDLTVFKNSAVLSDEQKAQVREYAKLQQEQERLEKEIKKLSRVKSMLNAKWCSKHLWTTLNGDVKPIFDLDADHLKNIVKYLKERGRVNTQITNEYITRFGFDELITEEDKFKPKKPSRWFVEEDYYEDEF